MLYHVLYFSKPVLQVNTLSGHLQTIIQLYRSLNARIVTPIIEVIDRHDCTFVVSNGYERTLGDLVHKREGLTDF